MTPDLRALADRLDTLVNWVDCDCGCNRKTPALKVDTQLVLGASALRSAADQLDAQKAEIETKQDFIESGDAEIVQLQAEIDRQWQPIETAPKDATAVLVMRNIWPELSDGIATECNEHNTYVAQWWSGENRGHGAWVCYMDAVHDPLCPIDPTHWMPLPKAPT